MQDEAGKDVVPEEDEEDEPEEEVKPKKAKKGGKKKAPSANLDLIREAGVYGNFEYGPTKGGARGEKLVQAMGGFTQLNTIEEEKHETQTSNYFREGAGLGAAYESEDNVRGSRVMEDDAMRSSASPYRGPAKASS